MSKTVNLVHFVLVDRYRQKAGYSFDCYTDINGDLQYESDRKDEYGRPIKRRFIFSLAQNNTISVPAHQKRVIEFLRNCPDCEGSPNYTGGRIMYREINTGKDAEIALDNMGLKLEAINKAFALEGKELEEVSYLIGVDSKDVKIQKHKVMMFAEKNPGDFLELYNSPDRKAKSLIRKGLATGVLRSKGKIVVWEDVTVGVDEESAVSALLKDKKLNEAIEKAISKIG